MKKTPGDKSLPSSFKFAPGRNRGGAMSSNSVPVSGFLPLDFFLFCATVVMTLLTFAKESVLYQNNPDGWRRLVYLVATHAYYPASFLLLATLLLIAWQRRGTSIKSIFFRAACVLFFVNLALASANNIINLLRGHPLHRVHKGIGW